MEIRNRLQNTFSKNSGTNDSTKPSFCVLFQHIFLSFNACIIEYTNQIFHSYDHIPKKITSLCMIFEPLEWCYPLKG